jgi:hypothetical protein
MRVWEWRLEDAWRATHLEEMLSLEFVGARTDPTHGNGCVSLVRKQALIRASLCVVGSDRYEGLLSDLGKTLDGNRFGIPFTP